MNGNTKVIASISLLLLQHSASFSKLSWSDLSLVKWQLSALKDFLKRELRVIQGESVQFSFTPTHSLFLYFLLRFPGTDILYKYKPQLYSHASLTQVSRSLPLHGSLELYSVHNLLGAKTHLQNLLLWKQTAHSTFVTQDSMGFNKWCMAGSGLDGVTPMLIWALWSV